MVINQKTVKVLNKIFEAGFTTEKDISAMTMDDILSMQGITVTEIEVLGKPALFHDMRIDRNTVPKGLYLYEVRHVLELLQLLKMI